MQNIHIKTRQQQQQRQRKKSEPGKPLLCGVKAEPSPKSIELNGQHIADVTHTKIFRVKVKIGARLCLDLT